MTVVIEHLAARPDTPPVILAHLLQLARGALAPQPRSFTQPPVPDPVYSARTALAANPALDTTQLRALAQLPGTREAILRTVCSRADLTGAQVGEVLGTGATAADLIDALRRREDTDGGLARHAMTHGRGNGLWTALLKGKHTPDDVRHAAATALAHNPRSIGAATARAITALSQRRLQRSASAADHSATCAWIADLAAATTHGGLTYALAGLDLTYRPLEPGTPPWLSSPSTPLAAVLAWAAQVGTAAAWRTAHTHTPDPTGTLAAAACAAHPYSPQIAMRVLNDPAAPVRCRQEAAHLTSVHYPQDTATRAATFLHLADADFAVWFVSWLPCHIRQVTDVAHRTDLTPGHLDTLTSRRERLTHPSWRAGYADHWGLLLATHPCASPEQRATGRAMAAAAHADAGGRRRAADPTVRSLAKLVGHADVHDPAALVVAGGSLPTSVLGDGVLLAMPGIRAMVNGAIAAHLPDVTSPDAARTLTVLSSDFPGTIAELFTTTAAVSS